METPAKNTGPVAVGAKGTIVSLMEKELQHLEESNSKLKTPQQIQHLKIREEVVSIYCGSLLTNNCRNTEVSYKLEKPFGRSTSLKNTPPSGTPRKKKVLYHSAATSVMSSLEHDCSTIEQKKTCKNADDMVPILGAVPGVHKKAVQDGFSSPVRFSVPAVVDTRCYRGGREIFRSKSSTTSQTKHGFWRL